MKRMVACAVALVLFVSVGADGELFRDAGAR